MTQSVCIISKKGNVLVGIIGSVKKVTRQPTLFCVFPDNLYICSEPNVILAGQESQQCEVSEDIAFFALFGTYIRMNHTKFQQYRRRSILIVLCFFIFLTYYLLGRN